MDLFLARVRRLWNTWDLQILVLLSLSLQIILSLLGNRRRYMSSLWISVFVWLAYLMADWAATIALGKLSDSQVNYGNGKSLRVIWAPLLLLHLGGPDTITAYSMEDNHLWMRHFFGLVVQFSVAVYVIIMSWTHSWFSTMSIPALVAGFIKYGERTYVLRLVSRDRSGVIVPFRGSNLSSNNTSEDQNSIRVLCIAHECLDQFKRYMMSYDVKNQLVFAKKPPEVDDINQFWKAIEVEMGFMFDLFYTKTPINFRKRGWILRCITFVCTVTVLIGSTFELISTREEDQEKWHKVDIAITEVLVVGALASEIYAVIALYLFSDWAMLWLIKHNRLGEQVIQLRKKISWLFLPKQYRCNMMGQFDFISSSLKIIEADQALINRILLLLGIDHSKYRVDKYVHKTTVAVNSRLLDPILHCCQRLRSDGRLIRDDWTGFDDTDTSESRIFFLHVTTEVCYYLEMEWDTDDDASESRVVSQHTMPPSGSSSSLEENRELSRTLSHYMMYILVKRPSLLPTASSDKDHLAALKDGVPQAIREFSPYRKGTRDVKAACRDCISNIHPVGRMVERLKSKQKDERWEKLKSVWVRMLCDTAIKCHRYEHLRQLTQGGEFLTFLWFFIPQSEILADNQVLPQSSSSPQSEEEVNTENSEQEP